jgi:dihydrofolate reductase
LENPLGVGGQRLHEWLFATWSWQAQHGAGGGETNVDSQVVAKASENIGAYVMGRKMFGGGDGPWDTAWTGWWDDDPPFHVPVFVLTHHPREPLVMKGGTTFYFVNDGVESAVAQAREAAGESDVAVPGGAQAVQQVLAAGLLDRLQLHVVPVILGAGERLLANVGEPVLEPIDVVASPRVTHLTYRVVR